MYGSNDARRESVVLRNPSGKLTKVPRDSAKLLRAENLRVIGHTNHRRLFHALSANSAEEATNRMTNR
jgi:hypothetical protein